MRENVLSFEALTSRIQLTQICENLTSNIVWQLGSSTKFDRMKTTDGGKMNPSCREYTCSPSFPKSQVLAAIPEDTIFGPVLEVQIVKIIDG